VRAEAAAQEEVPWTCRAFASLATPPGRYVTLRDLFSAAQEF
jgi:hypothetical protein